MRIVAGTLRGRTLKAPKGESTRPTTDRVREALFSALASIAGPDLGAGRALDAFAGSGALGLEALSRGVASATFVERDRAALATLNANVDALGVRGFSRVVQGDTLALARRGAVPGGPFALLLLDPPYRLDAAEVTDLISALIACDLLESGAIVVYEHEVGRDISWPDDVHELAAKRYGSTAVDIAVYERGAGSS